MNLLRRSPLLPSATRPSPICAQCTTHIKASFSSTPTLEKRNKDGKKDIRVQHIRYFLRHPLTPRPLRFSRERYLRHWTIHRAWQLYQSDLRQQHQLELERQYNSMREACEVLRLMDGNGIVSPASSDGQSMGRPSPDRTDVGRLYRKAMHKGDIWRGIPIEYARMQTDTPGTEPWDHGWKR